MWTQKPRRLIPSSLHLLPDLQHLWDVGIFKKEEKEGSDSGWESKVAVAVLNL